jgi:hypothetical protein
MAGQMCAMALKGANGKNATRKPAFACYCEPELKSAGMWVIHGGGQVREPARAKEAIPRDAGRRPCETTVAN